MTDPVSNDNDRSKQWPPWPDPYIEEAIRMKNDAKTFWTLVEASMKRYFIGLFSRLEEAIKNYRYSWKGEGPYHVALKLNAYAHFAAYRDLTKMPIRIEYELGYHPFDLLIQDLPYVQGVGKRIGCECLTLGTYEKDPFVIARKLANARFHMSMGLLTNFIFWIEPALLTVLKEDETPLDGSNYTIPVGYDIFLKAAKHMLATKRP